MTIQFSETDAADLFSRLNNAGEGYAIGEDGDTPQEAVEREEDTILAVYDNGLVLAEEAPGMYYLVGDAHGPWAVRLPGHEVE